MVLPCPLVIAHLKLFQSQDRHLCCICYTEITKKIDTKLFTKIDAKKDPVSHL